VTADVMREAETLYMGVAERNAVVLHRLMRAQGRVIGLRASDSLLTVGSFTATIGSSTS